MKYEQQKEFFQKCYFNQRHGWGTNKISPNIKNYLEKIQPGTLLDIGCGHGKYTILSQKLGFQSQGIDYIPSAIEKAKEKSEDLDCTFITNDFFKQKFTQKFDTVLDSGFLHHIKKIDWPLYTKKLLHLTKPKSNYILSCFSEKDTTHKRAKRHLIHYNHYDYFFSREDLGKLFAKNFKIIKINEEKSPLGKCFLNCLMERH
jgi:2-polyprenyl-3-methyl-5-hydroxy-6-metoxy-1,4-benzoquinol methylase